MKTLQGHPNLASTEPSRQHRSRHTGQPQAQPGLNLPRSRPPLLPGPVVPRELWRSFPSSPSFALLSEWGLTSQTSPAPKWILSAVLVTLWPYFEPQFPYLQPTFLSNSDPLEAMAESNPPGADRRAVGVGLLCMLPAVAVAVAGGGQVPRAHALGGWEGLSHALAS